MSKIRQPTEEEWPILFSHLVHYQRLWQRDVLTREEAVQLAAYAWRTYLVEYKETK